MSDIAELGIKVDSSALLTLTEQLDRCTASARALKAALDGLGDGFVNVDLRAVGDVAEIKIEHIAVKCGEQSPLPSVEDLQSAAQSPPSPDAVTD